MPSPTLAVFDFDETIISRDTLASFWQYTHARSITRKAVGGVLSSIKTLFSGSLVLRSVLNSMMLWTGTIGLNRSRLEDDFFRDYLDGENAVQVYPEAMERVQWHIGQGHRIVILSASLGSHITRAVERLLPGIECQIIGSTQADLLGGLVLKRYCSGARKIDMACEAGLPEAEWGFGYSDSARDAPLLRHCKEKFLINPSSEFVKQATAEWGEGFKAVKWGRPTGKGQPRA